MEIEIIFAVTEDELNNFAHVVHESTAGHISPEEAIEIVLEKNMRSLLDAEIQNLRVSIAH